MSVSLSAQKNDLILVTGAGGFVGGNMLARLRADGFTNLRGVDIKPQQSWYQRFDDVDMLTLDLTDPAASHRAAADARYIFNFAADMGGMGFIETQKAACMLSVRISTNMLVAARDAKTCERFFYSSSACVYNAAKQADPELTALAEKDAYPAMPEDGYGWEKLFSERMARHFREDFGLETRIARFHNVYGPWGTFEGGRERAPAAICRKVIDAKLTGSHQIEIWGDGQQTRSFMYIDDCLEGVQRLTSSDFFDPINLGSDELFSINQLVDMVEDIAGITLERSYNLSAPKGVRGRNSDNTLIRQTLGWAPSTRLRTGLEKTYAWIHDRMTNATAEQRKAYS